MLRITAYWYAMFFLKSGVESSSCANLAPAIILSISTPLTAIGNNPTAVRTVKRPPTSSGTTKVSYPSSSASNFNAPRALSVVA